MDSLDNIVNAVTEILLVFEEAQKDFSTNLKVDPKNLENLVHSITQMVEDNRKLMPQIDDDNLKKQMNQTFDDTTGAAKRLETLIKNQPNGFIQRSSYRSMHEELAIILHNMVVQVQIVDNCNVKILMNTAKKTLDCVARINKADSVSALDAISRDMNKLTDLLQQYMKTRVQETTNPDISDRMARASESVKSGVQSAMSASQAALQNPSSQTKDAKDKQLRQLVESLQELFSSVVQSSEFIGNFVLQFPMPVRHEQDDKRNPRVGPELARLENAVKKRDAKETDAALQSLDHEVTKQAQHGRAVAANMKDARAKEAMLDDIKELEKLVPQIATAAKNVIKNPNDKHAEEAFQNLVDAARRLNDRIEDAKKPEHQFIENSKLLDAAMKRLRDAVDRGDKDAAIQAVREVADYIAKQVAYARSMADQMKDPKNKKIVLDAADELERLVPELVAALKETLANPNDKAARKKFDDLMAKVKEEEEKIAKAIIEDQLATNNANIKAKIDELYDAVARGDAQRTSELLKDIDELGNRRIDLGKKLADQVHDPRQKKQILNAVELLQKDLPELHSAANTAVKNPSDQKAMERLHRVGEEIKEACNHITSNRYYDDRLPEQVIANGRNLEDSLAMLADAVRRGDAKAAAAAARDVANQIAKQVALGRQLAASCDDPVLKKKILDACDELERLSPLIVQATKDALMNPDDKEAQKRLEQLLEKARQQNKIITDAAEIIKNNRDKPKQPKVAESKKAEFPESKDAIMVAANQVNRAAREASAPIFPEQKDLIEIAKAIAEEMEKLSLAAQRNSKKDMITAARNIAGMIGKIQTFSTLIAEKCTDQKLRDHLLNICRVPKNFAVQLKIISAVKATSDDNDKAAEHQLITCAQGLANSVVQTVKAAEACCVAQAKNRK